MHERQRFAAAIAMLASSPLPDAAAAGLSAGIANIVVAEPVERGLMQGVVVYPAKAAAVPVICVDPPGIDRAAIHTKINAEMVAFFRRTLAVP